MLSYSPWPHPGLTLASPRSQVSALKMIGVYGESDIGLQHIGALPIKTGLNGYGSPQYRGNQVRRQQPALQDSILLRVMAYRTKTLSGVSTAERVRQRRERRAALSNAPVPEYNDDYDDTEQYNETTQFSQERMMNLWADWCEAEGKPDSYLLKEGWTLPPTSAFKQFLRFAIDAREDRGGPLLEPEPASALAMKVRVGNFWSGIKRRISFDVPKAIKTEILGFIDGRLQKEGLVTSKTQKKESINKRDMTHLMSVLWTEPDPSKSHPRVGRSRVLLSGAVMIGYTTGARTGAIIPQFPSAEARNTAVEAGIRRYVRRDSNFQRRADSEHEPLKGLRWETSASWRDDLRHDTMAWLLALAFADDVFEHHSSARTLFELVLSDRVESASILYKPGKRDLHVFRPSLTSATALPQKAFGDWFRLWTRQSGYTHPLVFYRFRQEVTNKVDAANVSAAQRKHTVGHSRAVFNRSYIHSISNVDVQSLYLGEKPRADYFDHLTSASCSRIKGFPIKLPLNIANQVCAADEVYQNLEKQKLKAEANDARGDLQGIRDQMRCLRKRLLRNHLKLYQAEWVQKFRAESAFTNPADLEKPDFSTSRFDQELSCKPRQRIIAQVMSGEIEYSSAIRPKIIDVLAELAREEEVRAYRPNEEPRGRFCPVIACGKELPM
ncbi:hypothetical protein H2204_011724 [Knufia peltigerae]|uniref:Uncharacterized protein n=1 Tax=Knufia peltigerae TaxID=1002370 RepID=A0AA38XTN2_9EURO|nr:hypothetical protein H2204_011724 [Knufia peltigerae]